MLDYLSYLSGYHAENHDSQICIITCWDITNMFGELINFIDVLRASALDFRSRQLGVKRKAVISTLLETYFYLKDATDEGEMLVEDAAPSPVEVIKSLSPADAKVRLAKWDSALQRQTFRLMRISERVFGQDFLDVLSPSLRESLNNFLGSKFERATSLHGIGATLYFRSWVDGSQEEKARYVSVMAGEVDDLLHMEKIRDEIVRLRDGMETYRLTVHDLATSDELILLSQAARTATLLPHEALA